MPELYMVDVDGTLCETEGTDYASAKPRWDQIKKINDLFVQGHTIVIWTARGAGISDPRDSKQQSRCNRLHELTKHQLETWGVLYHRLRMDKPVFDKLIDDRTLRIEEL